MASDEITNGVNMDEGDIAINYLYGKTIEEWEALKDTFEYNPVNFKDRIVEEPNTHTEEDMGVDEEGRRRIRHVPSPGKIYQEGTPLNSEMIGQVDMAIYILYSISKDHKKLIDDNETELASLIESATQDYNQKITDVIEELKKYKLKEEAEVDMQNLQNKIEEVKILANSNLDKISELFSLIRYENGVLVIGKAGEPLAIEITDEKVVINANGEHPISITNDLVTLEKVKVLDSIILGNHIIETFGNETIIRKVS